MLKFLDSKAGTVAIGIITAAAVLWFFSRRASSAVGDAASAVGTAFNPLDQGNLVNRGVNAIGDQFDGGGDDDSFSFGSWLFDLFNPEYDPNAPVVSADDELRLIQWDQLPRRRGAI